MNRFVATLNGGETINTPAERMKLKENVIYVWRVVCAYISEKGTQ